MTDAITPKKLPDLEPLIDQLVRDMFKSVGGYDDMMKGGLTESLMVRTTMVDGWVDFEVISRERYIKPDERG